MINGNGSNIVFQMKYNNLPKLSTADNIFIVRTNKGFLPCKPQDYLTPDIEKELLGRGIEF